MDSMTPDDFRTLALALPGAKEGSHMQHPDFRVGDKIFATLWKEDGVLMLRPEQQSLLVESDPTSFSPASGGWGRKGSTVVHLKVAHRAAVAQGLMAAWETKSMAKSPAPVRRKRSRSALYPSLAKCP
jgi:YjbR